MKKSKLIDFLLCLGALIVSALVSLLAAVRAVSTNTAIVFLGLSIACVAMSLVDTESPLRSQKKTRK